MHARSFTWPGPAEAPVPGLIGRTGWSGPVLITRVHSSPFLRGARVLGRPARFGARGLGARHFGAWRRTGSVMA